VEQRGNSLYAGCSVFKALSKDAILSVGGDGPSAPFFEYFYRVDGIKSGMHHPEGMLWVRRPDRKHHLHPEKVPLTAVAPMILDMFPVPKPEFMRTRLHPGFAGLCT